MQDSLINHRKDLLAWILGMLLVLSYAHISLADDELDYGLEQHLLFRIVLSGNQHYSDSDLKSILRIKEPRTIHPSLLLGLSDRSARYQPHLLEVELRVLEKYYKRNGFHQATVSLDSVGIDRMDRGDIIHISISEGIRTYLASVDFDRADPLDPEDLRDELQYTTGVPAPHDLNDLGQDIYTLRLEYWEKGFLNVSIIPEIISLADSADRTGTQQLIYHIDSGLSYTIRDIRINGNRTTLESLIRGELRVKPGDTFKWSAVEGSQMRLMETALFRDVSFTPVQLDSETGTTDMLVEVVERKPAYFEFGFGVGSRERVRLLTAWGHNNIFGVGQRLRLRARNYLNYEDVQRLSNGNVDPELNYQYDITHSHPALLAGYRLDTRLYAEKETRGESGLNLKTGGISFGTRFIREHRAVDRFEFRIEEVDPLIHPDAISTLREAFEASDLRQSGTHSLAWTIYDERRDNPLKPNNGTVRSVQMEYAGGVLGADNSFYKISGDYHRYVRPPFGGVIAMRVSAGYVRPFGDSRAERGNDGVPYQERFFAGGVSTVRGYQERTLGPQITDQAVLDSLQLSSNVPLPDQPARGGNYLLLSNIEWRFPLIPDWHLGGVLFVDGGNVWEHASDIRLKGFRWRSYARDPDEDSATKLWDYRYSTGWGLRLDTPVGPVRFDVGYPLKRAQLSDTRMEDRVIYHFSLGYPF
jgi:outer membrane protein insertion porin family